MKHVSYIFSVLAIATIGLSSCKKEEPSQIIIAKKPVATEPRQTQRIGDYDQTMDVEWGGATYSLLINRHADESLPLADDGTGNKFFDNKISVKIVRSDGSVFFERTFLKSDFSQYLDDRSRKNDALLGVVYDKVEGENILFAASVGSPDIVGSDEYIPFVVSINRGGKMSIKKDVLRDIVGDGEAQDDIVDEGV